MIKKITLTLLLCFIILSCGKKGDPEYQESQKRAKMQTILTIKAL